MCPQCIESGTILSSASPSQCTVGPNYVPHCPVSDCVPILLRPFLVERARLRGRYLCKIAIEPTRGRRPRKIAHARRAQPNDDSDDFPQEPCREECPHQQDVQRRGEQPWDRRDDKHSRGTLSGSCQTTALSTSQRGQICRADKITSYNRCNSGRSGLCAPLRSRRSEKEMNVRVKTPPG